LKGCVLDSSALFYGKDLPSEYECVVTPGVVQELRRHGLADRLELLLDTKIRELSPSILAVRAVREAAAKTGDARRLSETDIEILALAFEMKYELVTDDYSIQNLAKVMGVKTAGMEQSGIREVFEWQAKCTGCGKLFTAEVEVCDICGSSTRTKRKGTKKPRRAPGSRS
jgi:UPF0271 protein